MKRVLQYFQNVINKWRIYSCFVTRNKDVDARMKIYWGHWRVQRKVWNIEPSTFFQTCANILAKLIDCFRPENKILKYMTDGLKFYRNSIIKGNQILTGLSPKYYSHWHQKYTNAYKKYKYLRQFIRRCPRENSHFEELVIVHKITRG